MWLKDFIIKITPFKLRRKLYIFIQKLYQGYWESVTKSVPKYELSQKHIQHTQLVSTRDELLYLLPKNGIIAEMGVDKGEFSEKILTTSTPSELHLIDVWNTERYDKNKQQNVEEKFKDKENVNIHIGYSTQVAHQFPNNYFDWVYIDTDHTYKTTLAELEAYAPKIKEDGFLVGHDFIVGHWNGMVKYGVIEAVYEFCYKYDWQIRYLTAENNNPPSFALQRIK